MMDLIAIGIIAVLYVLSRLFITFCGRLMPEKDGGKR